MSESFSSILVILTSFNPMRESFGSILVIYFITLYQLLGLCNIYWEVVGESQIRI